MKRFVLASVGLFVLCSSSFSAQLRIVSWNTAGEARTGTTVVLEALGSVDVLALQEQASNDTESILALLNSFHGADVFAIATPPSNARTNGGGLPGLIFNTKTIELLEAVAFGDVSTNAQARSTLRYELWPIGFDETFFVYNNHYKASTGSTNEERRNVEATALRANLDSLGDDVAAILAGDFNIRDSDQAMYQTLLSDGPGQAFDPIDTPGDLSLIHI